MRQFASSGFRIWNLGIEAKVVYTGFGLFALLALFVSVLFYEDMVGPRTAGVAGYYAGSASVTPARDKGGDVGPRIELPSDTPAAPLTVAVTYRKLLEVTHFHLFTVPVFLLIIAHLFMLTGLRPLTKLIWILAGFVASLVHLAAPWLVRFAGAGWAWLYIASGALMAVALTLMTIYPIVVMWTGPRAAR